MSLQESLKANPLTSSDPTPNENEEVSTQAAEQTAVAAEPNPCEREVSVEVSAEQVSREWQSTLARFQKHARLPGFRNGKVPSSLIRKKFSEAIKSEVVEHLVPTAFREETKKQNLVPIGQPRVVELDVEESQPLRFKAIFEVLPPFDITGYQEIKAPYEPAAVGDEEVDKAIENLREQSATYINVDEDRGLADGEYGSVSFKGSSAEEGAEPVEMNDVLVEIGGDKTVPAFSENLRGAKAGETRSFDVTYEEDFADQRLAGKTMHYDVEVKAIKIKSIPECNDEWVKEIGQEDLNTVDELRARIREGMEHEKKHQAEHQMKEDLLRQLTERFPIDVPTLLVENSIDRRLERGLRSLMGQGLRAEDLKRMDLGKLREGQREGALRDVRANLVLDKIAEQEGIAVTEEDVDAEIARAAQASQQPPAALRKQLEENNGLEGVREQMRCDRALDWLFRRCLPPETEKAS
jgi:trigger factor